MPCQHPSDTLPTPFRRPTSRLATRRQRARWVQLELPFDGERLAIGGERVMVKRRKREPERLAERPFDDEVPF